MKLIPRNRDPLYGITDSSNDAVDSLTPKPKSQGRPIDTVALVACYFVNACQISGVLGHASIVP